MNLQVGGPFGEWLLHRLTARFGPSEWTTYDDDPVPFGAARLERVFGAGIREKLRGKTVVDFGAGRGYEALSAAALGASQVVGLEIRANDVATARRLATEQHLADVCRFLDPSRDRAELDALRGTVDVVFSIDAFEHFTDPAAILREMHDLLRPGGSLLLWFGPIWKHPYGAHLGHFNRLPWLHFIFSEDTIVRVRHRYIPDAATTLNEIGDGMNRMTIAWFEQLVRAAAFEPRRIELCPIKRLPLVTAWRATREYFTSVVKAELVKPA